MLHNLTRVSSIISKKFGDENLYLQIRRNSTKEGSLQKVYICVKFILRLTLNSSFAKQKQQPYHPRKLLYALGTFHIDVNVQQSQKSLEIFMFCHVKFIIDVSVPTNRPRDRGSYVVSWAR